MKKIEIKRNSLGDIRTAERVPTFEEFENSNILHRADVGNMMCRLADDIIAQGSIHDWTKIREPHSSLFYRELCAKIEGKIDSFSDGEWYPMHCKTERHHLTKFVPDDVNLIDVLEMVCDCVCAGMARSGNVYPIEIPSEVLQKALANTVQMCIDAVVVKE